MTTTDTEKARALYEDAGADCGWCGSLCPDDADLFINEVANALAKEREATWDEVLATVMSTRPAVGSAGLTQSRIYKALEAARNEGNK